MGILHFCILVIVFWSLCTYADSLPWELHVRVHDVGPRAAQLTGQYM